MIGLVMAGGKGMRMNLSEEKLLLGHKKQLVLHVVDALRESNRFSKILAATSENSPNTHKLLVDYGVDIVKTKGESYVSDLNYVLSGLDDFVFVVSGDLPLLDNAIIQELVAKHDTTASWQSFVVTKKFLDSIDIQLEFKTNVDGKECYYTGVSIVNPKKISPPVQETYTISDDKRIAINLNTKKDYDLLKNS
ncbi:MAG: NTP transferase domain-containing protein [Thaumarchaeota archaeon]|nr:NTP transferase domain-containing protein [Nitrososphaerota archaeon]